MTNVKTIKVRSDSLPRYMTEELPAGVVLSGNAHPDVGTVLYSPDRKYSIIDIDDLSPYAFSCKFSDAQYVSNAEIADRIANHFSASGAEHEQTYQQALAFLMRSRPQASELSATDPASTYQHYLTLWQERCAKATQNLADIINRLASASAQSQPNQRNSRSEKDPERETR